ncbi:hypothetical protein Tco_0114879 [Tanacetum coccineum]
MISLIVPSLVATPAMAETKGFLTKQGAQVEMQGRLICNHAVRLEELSLALFKRYDRDIGELFTRSGQLGMRFSPRGTDLGLVEERHARLELAEVVDSMRRGLEPKGGIVFGKSDGGGGELGGGGEFGGGGCESMYSIFGNGSSSGCHGGLWWLIENEKMVVGDGVLAQEATSSSSLSPWSREVGMIWSFSVLGVCKSTKILFICEYGLTSEWDSKDLTELLERKSDEFVLNHEGDKNDVGVIFLKSNLTIKV